MIVDNKDSVDNTQTLRNTLDDEDGTDTVFASAGRLNLFVVYDVTASIVLSL